jgi:ATP-dependent DNA helicase RecG
VNIGRADKLGSGVRNLYKYTKIYSGGEPELIEGDVFKTILPLKEIGSVGANGDLNGDVIGDPNGDPSITIRITIPNAKNDTQDAILAALRDTPTLTASDLAAKIGITDRNIKQNIKALKDAGLLERIGTNRKGQWIVKA